MKMNNGWRLGMAMAMLTLAHSPDVSVAQVNTDARDPKRPVRLALLDSTTGADSVPDLRTRGVLLDLLTVRLTATPGFELVERSAMEAILRELSLSMSSLSKPAEAVRVGQMLKADWLLLVSFPERTTNAVLGKILDASTGIIRDLQLVTMKPGEPSSAVEAITGFVIGANNPSASLKDRLWIGFGGFEDLGLHQRYRNFGEQLRTAMSLKYAGSRVSVVERSHVRPLLDELQLSLNGFTAVRTNLTSAQQAFVLVDGLYQAFQDERSSINVVLRMEWVGGRQSAVSIKETPGPAIEAKVGEAIDRFLAMSPTVTITNSPTKQAELRAQLKRGQELARMGSGFTVPMEGVFMWSVFPRDRAPRVREAISAFESALFLAPESLEAKFGLAACLVDPLLDQVEGARDIWREIAVTTTNLAAVMAARNALAGSYVDRDNMQAHDLLMALRNAATNIEQRATFDSTLQMVRSRLEEGGLDRTNILEFATDAWRTACQVAELNVARGRRIDTHMNFWNPMGGFDKAFTGARSTEERREHVGMVVSNLANEFPKLEAYLVNTYIRGGPLTPYWQKRFEQTLILCEENPESIPDPFSYFDSYLMENLSSFIRGENFPWAERVAKMFEKHGAKYLRTQSGRDEVDFLIGYLHIKRADWEKAVRAFERIGPRQVKTFPPDGIWGKPAALSGVRAAQITRQLAALAAAPSGKKLSPSLKPVRVFPGPEVVFAVDDSRMWIADRTGFYRYDFRNDTLESVPIRANLRVRSILTHRDKVWFATAEGLYAFDPRDKSVVTNAVDQGLLMPSVTALCADADRLWVGFGSSKGGSSIGGLGFMKLPENRFVGLMSELPATLASTPARKRERPDSMQSAGAQRRYITGLAKSTSGPLWVTSTSRLFRYGIDDDAWEAVIPAMNGAVVGTVAASSNYVVIPCYEPTGWSSMDTNFGGVFIYDVQKKTSRRLTNTDGLPNNKLYSAVIDGQKAWLGGDGFLAVIDLPSARLDKIWPLSSAFPVRSLAMTGNDLWFSSGPGLYRLSNDAETEAVLAASGATKPAAAPEITDAQAARDLLKKRGASYQTYGTLDTMEGREMTAQFNAFIRGAAKDFLLLEPVGPKSTNHFIELTMNKHGRGIDGFRFRGTLQEPADFGWILASEQPTSFNSWFITPAEDTPMKGFNDLYPPKVAYTNAPWTGLPTKFSVTLQFLHDGQILPGKEYIIWMDFRDERPARFFIAFDLFPASARHRSRTVLEGTFGLSGPPLRRNE